MEDAGIFAREWPALDRYVQVGVASGRVLHVSVPETPDSDAGEEHPVLSAIFEYLEGDGDDALADVRVALTVPTDQRRVLERVQAIPYGESITVDSLARTVPGLAADEEGRSLVRSALRNNPAPLLIPDHRVEDGPSAVPTSVVETLRRIEGL